MVICKALNETVTADKSIHDQYKNISFPALLVYFDNKTDHGYFKWIKKPEENGELHFDTKNNVEELNNTALAFIVDEIKNWYSHKLSA